MIHDLLFKEYCKNHALSEEAVLSEALILYYRNTGGTIPAEATPEVIDRAKRHFLNKQETFTMDLMTPGCVPRKPRRSGQVIN